MSPVAKPGWIMTAPVVSTSHLDAETGADLAGQTLAGNGNRWGLCVVPMPTGSLVFVGDDPMDDLPQCFQDVFAKVKEWEHEWVRLDSDGDIIEGLPTFDW
ncbi:hypothetical protein AB7849_15515 [Rhodanobacter sp. 115]|uniref:DUF5983 family protein n=1 Tax=Rhodanobacter sp. FW021-MT20 TaxID=1162282 RepID=UPI0034E5EA0B